MPAFYQPPYQITPIILHIIEEIGEWIGRYSVTAERVLTPQLRRNNRIRTIQASLAIENNTLSLEQVTAVLKGKRVLGLPREIQEVRNAFAAYDGITRWNPASLNDLLEAHATLMAGLVDRPGSLRQGNVGIFRGEQVVHLAPPAKRVPDLVSQLLQWVGQTNEHPLIASSVFHYEFELIHPFPDGNGRLGRLWQTLILSQWKPLLSYLPVETVIRDRQEEYYKVLAQSDSKDHSTQFIEFMLDALRSSIEEAIGTDQVTDQVTDPVNRLLKLLQQREMSATELMSELALTHRPTFRKNYLEPALAAGLIERTNPDSPRSPIQRYRLTPKGRLQIAK